MFFTYRSPRMTRALVRVLLSVAVALVTIGTLVHPQGKLRAAEYTVTTCDTAELINVYNTAISTPADDNIYLRPGCTYTFSTANPGSGRALATLPATSSAGRLGFYGRGATITRTGSNFGFIQVASGGNLDLHDTVFSAFNSGAQVGGVFYTSGSLAVNGSAIVNSGSNTDGGAIYADANANLLVSQTAFYTNTGFNGGAIFSAAPTYIRRSSFTQNRALGYGGALALIDRGATVINSTFGTNRADNNGGAISVSAGNSSFSYFFYNNTIFQNTADNNVSGVGDGGGFYMAGVATNRVTLSNTVVAQNSDASASGNQHEDVSGNFQTTNINNFISTDNGMTGITNGTNGNRVGTIPSPLNPLLGAFGSRPGESGFLGTYTPLPASPLINAGSNLIVSAMGADGSRDGRLYHRIQYSVVDIGSVEFKRADSPVIINPANKAWLFRYYSSPGAPDFSFVYGQGLSDYQPVVADWNGDDIDTQGLYTRYPASNRGVFALSNVFNGFDASTLPAFAYSDANPNWLPVAGDWDGNRADSIGVYDISTGIWVLSDSNASVTPNYPAFSFGGGSGIVPVAGDWDGNGYDGIGVYNFNTGRWFLSNGVGIYAGVGYSFVYTAAGYYPVVGDWNADGIDTVGLYNPNNGQWLLRNSNDTGSADIAFVYGAGSGLIGRAGQWRQVTPGNGTRPIIESRVTPVAPVVTPQIAPTFAP